jgi:translation initiation factor IF-2
MPLDDQIRQSSEAAASDLGRAIQDRLEQWTRDVLASAAEERDAALVAQAEQLGNDADARLREQLEKAREESAAEVSAAVARALDSARDETAQAVALAREEASNEAATLVARARDEVAQATAQLQADEDARQAERERLALARETRERDAMLAEMERLVESFRKLDGAETLKALLDALADSAALESARTAVFLVRGAELLGWRFAGFDRAPSDPRQVVVPLEAAGGLGAAVQRRARAEVAAGQASGPLAFMDLPGADIGVAVPVIVGGDVAAVVYGDDGGSAERVVPAGWPETLELLSRHASRCLEAQTAIRAARLGGVSAPAGLGRAADSPIDAGVAG